MATKKKKKTSKSTKRKGGCTVDTVVKILSTPAVVAATSAIVRELTGGRRR